MTTRPRDITPPYTLDKIRRMLDSWEGVPAKKVPAEVSIIAELYNALRESGKHNEHLANEVKALENFMDRVNRLTRQWPDEVARDREKQAWEGLHRDVIHQIERGHREYGKRTATNLARIAAIHERPNHGNNGHGNCGSDQRGSRLVGVGAGDPQRDAAE